MHSEDTQDSATRQPLTRPQDVDPVYTVAGEQGDWCEVRIYHDGSERRPWRYVVTDVFGQCGSGRYADEESARDAAYYVATGGVRRREVLRAALEHLGAEVGPGGEVVSWYADELGCRVECDLRDFNRYAVALAEGREDAASLLNADPVVPAPL